MTRTVLVTGGAGFVGSHLALSIKRDQPGDRVIAFDNLKRRGSELSIPRLKAGGVEFCHGDIRNPTDLADLGPFQLLLECSAEPSVHAGYGGSPAYVIDTNLVGTVHCLEAARQHAADVVFLSTSRVYPIDGLRSLPLREDRTRLVVPEHAMGEGWSPAGISTAFPLAGARSMYGATKLASELILAEYGALYGMRCVINRCGVLAGPWQMGKVDQGFLVLWAARHVFGGKLAYMGFAGRGLQVRDVLHVGDLYDLLRIQLADLDRHAGKVYNVGGGAERTVSLCELTELCAARAPRGVSLLIGSDPTTRAADIPYYVTDNADVTAATGWQPRRSLEDLLDEVFAWLSEHRERLQPILA